MKKQHWVLTPVFGTLLFIALYITATLLYPGGSQVDAQSPGFSWMNNYWCNLLNEYAVNGQYNPAKPVAIAGMLTLCITLAVFWYLFPLYIKAAKASRSVIQGSGILSMVIILFLFTGMHDMVINLASLFGLIALLGVFLELYRNRWYGLCWFGIFNLLLVALNNYVYYTEGFITYLPLIQKISFASFLLWFCWIDVRLYRMSVFSN